MTADENCKVLSHYRGNFSDSSTLELPPGHPRPFGIN